jgi:hypothetical protein
MNHWTKLSIDAVMANQIDQFYNEIVNQQIRINLDKSNKHITVIQRTFSRRKKDKVPGEGIHGARDRIQYQ